MFIADVFYLFVFVICVAAICDRFSHT